MREDRLYHHGQKLYVRKKMRFAGRDYAAGEVFPIRRLAVGPKQVKKLMGAGYLTHKLTLTPVKAIFPTAPAPVVEEEAGEEISREYLDTLDQEGLLDFMEEYEIGIDDPYDSLDALRDLIWNALPEEEEGAGEDIVVQDRGGGWYDVLIDGNPVNDSALRKKAADKLREKLLKKE